MTPELWLVVFYLLSATVGDLRVAKLNIHVGPVPLFYTDLTLLMLMILSLLRSPARVLYWITIGTGAGSIGRAAWIFCVIGVVYCALSIGQYHLAALQDMAIFGYSLFFPLTYFAMRDRRDARTLMRSFVFAGVALALLVVLQYVIGGVKGHATMVDGIEPSVYGERVAEQAHSFLGSTILQFGNQDDAACAIFALAALVAYIILERRWRGFHALCAAVCFGALTVSTSRATIVGLALAAAFTFICLRQRHRLRYALFVVLCGATLVGSAFLPDRIPGADLVRGLRVAVSSALGGPAVDSNADFRLKRWRYSASIWLEHPLFGEGFGRPIIPAGLIDATENKGDYNAGMPHNTFLFVAVRTGLLGLGVVLFCWAQVIRQLFSKFRRVGAADELAAINVLVAMFGFAAFVLFFERPVTNAGFWIVAAIGARLAQYQRPEVVSVRQAV
jgi:O-antigen ligase